MKATHAPEDAWGIGGHDGLTRGGSIGIWPPLGEFGLMSVGNDGLKSNAIRTP